MTRELFNRELQELQDDVLVLGSMAEKALSDAMAVLRDADLAAAKKIIEDDRLINQKRYEIEEKATFVMASQQPMAADLRSLTSVLYIISDLERIADHAVGIARINLLLGDEEAVPRNLGFIPAMADRSQAMLHDSLKAYVDQDIEESRRICDADDEVDALQDKVYDDLIQQMIDDPSTIQPNTYRLWTAHNLERIADRCTNIGERVIFMVTGRMEEINVSSY